MKNAKTPFIHVGNNLAMDFINTEVVSNGEKLELLCCIDDLYKWAVDTGITIGCQHESIKDDASLNDVHGFRRSLKALITAHINKEPLPEKSLTAVNQYLLHAPCQQQLSVAGQHFSLRALDEQLSITQLLGKIALAAGTLLASPNGLHVKNCSNSKCVLMFVDTSRSKKRRWCSMDSCGNRAKANAFYHSSKSH